MNISTQDVFCVVFKDYPDVLDVKQVSQLLSISTKTVYRLLRNGTIDSLKIGREFRVPKVNIMKYVKVLNPLLTERHTA
ncbi:MAG: helix-turn-helix domain-containing protein [Oscillospiraceae bacterium]|nr:helix-turn-helix domain-containing protein [Oscillospiraceae bacterium]